LDFFYLFKRTEPCHWDNRFIPYWGDDIKKEWRRVVLCWERQSHFWKTIL